MRAVIAPEPGGVEALHVADLPIPEPAAGEILIGIDAAGLNRADLLQRQGFYPPPPGITDVLCRTIETGDHDFLLCNFANADMVGHTGVLPAVIKAVETVDGCLARVLASAEKARCSVLVTADHGNSEMMIDPVTGGVHTAHTTNPVPFVAVGSGATSLRAGGSLRDVAPTVLRLLGIEPPADMTGRDLREC